MIPGPVKVDQEVLSEMGSPLVAHYGREWTEFYNETIRLMKKVFQTSEGDVFLIPGSGSAGLDAAIGSVLSNRRKALVLINGFFGRRLLHIAKAYTNKIETIDFELGKPVVPARVEKVLANNEDIEAVLAVHCETSTGVVNPIKEIGKICRKFGVLLIVDAISSLAGMDLKTDKWDIGICVSASQKCLAAPPGISPVAVKQRAWDLIEEFDSPGWYLNLRTWKEFSIKWAEWHPFPVTMPVNNILALRRSLEKILEEGLENRFQRHERVSSFLRQGLQNIDFELFPEVGYYSSTVTSVKADPRISVGQLLEFLKENFEIKIAGSPGELKGKIFRIGHMGPGATLDSVIPLLFAIEEALRDAGVRVEVGQSLQDIKVNTKG